MAYTDFHKYYDEMNVGDEWVSAGRTITEADVINFAGLSGDFNPMHMDHQYAAETPFRKPIAHGILIQAIGSGLGLNAPMMRTLAVLSIKEWYFRLPVYFGDTVRARTKVLALEAGNRGRRGVVTWKREIVNQENNVVQEGIIQTLVEGKGEK